MNGTTGHGVKQLWAVLPHPSPLFLFVLLYLLHNLPLLWGVPLSNDTALYFYPVEHVLGQALRQGTLPFWTTELQAGFPLLADGQPGMLYPLNLLLFGSLPTLPAHNLNLVIHGLLALMFTYWWARTLQLGALSSAAVAFLYVMTTPLSGTNVPHLEALTWTPLLFVLTERLLLGRRPRDAWVIAPVVGIQWLAGFPQIAFYSLVASGLYLLMRVSLVPLSWRERAAILAGWSLGVSLGIALAAPQLLPTLELSRFSIRGGGISGSMASEGSLLPVALISLVQPAWRDFFQGAGFGASLYTGALFFALAAWTVWSRPRTIWFYPLLGMALITMLFGFGRFTPLQLLMRELPGFQSFRIPSRFLEITNLAILTFVGYGWEQLQGSLRTIDASGRHRLSILRRFLLAIAALYLLIFAVHPLLVAFRNDLIALGMRYTEQNVLGADYHLQSADYYSTKVEGLYEQVVAATTPTRADVWLPFGATVITLLLLSRTNASPRARQDSQRRIGVFAGPLTLLLLVLGLVELLGVRGVGQRVQPATILTQAPGSVLAIRQHASSRLCRAYSLVDAGAVTFSSHDTGLLLANQHLLWRVAGTGLYSPLGFLSYYDLMQELGGVNLAFGLRPVELESFESNRPLLNFLNVCYVLSRIPLEGFEEIARDGEIYVYHNPLALPRAMLVRGEEIHTAPFQRPTAVGDASVLSYEPGQVVISTSSETGGALVLSDTYHHGWTVTVDGKASPLLQVAGVFRGVHVAAGRHRVQFDYEPLGFIRGVMVASVAAVLTIAWGIAALHANRKRRQSS